MSLGFVICSHSIGVSISDSEQTYNAKTWYGSTDFFQVDKLLCLTLTDRNNFKVDYKP